MAKNEIDLVLKITGNKEFKALLKQVETLNKKLNQANESSIDSLTRKQEKAAAKAKDIQKKKVQDVKSGLLRIEKEEKAALHRKLKAEKTAIKEIEAYRKKLMQSSYYYNRKVKGHEATGKRPNQAYVNDKNKYLDIKSEISQVEAIKDKKLKAIQKIQDAEIKAAQKIAAIEKRIADKRLKDKMDITNKATLAAEKQRAKEEAAAKKLTERLHTAAQKQHAKEAAIKEKQRLKEEAAAKKLTEKLIAGEIKRADKERNIRERAIAKEEAAQKRSIEKRISWELSAQEKLDTRMLARERRVSEAIHRQRRGGVKSFGLTGQNREDAVNDLISSYGTSRIRATPGATSQGALMSRGGFSFTQRLAELEGISAKAREGKHALRDMQNVMEAFLLYKGFVFLQTQLVSLVGELVHFEHELAIVSTQLEESFDFSTVTSNLRKISQETGLGLDVLAKAQFEVVSANIALADSYEIVELAAKAAVAGGIEDVELAFNAALTQVNAFGLGVESFGRVFDMQFNLVKRGIFTYEQLATVIGDVAIAFADMGQDIETSNAALAAISQVFTGKQIERGATGLRNAVLEISEQQEKFEALGVAVVDRQGDFRDLTDIITDLDRAISGLSESGKKDLLRDLFPEKRALKGISTLINEKEKFAQFRREQILSGGDLNVASDAVNETLMKQANILRQDLLPAFEGITDGMGTMVSKINEANDVLPGLSKNLLVIAGTLAAIEFSSFMGGGRGVVSPAMNWMKTSSEQGMHRMGMGNVQNIGFNPDGSVKRGFQLNRKGRMMTGGAGAAVALGGSMMVGNQKNTSPGDLLGIGASGAMLGGMVGGIPGAAIGGGLGIAGFLIGDIIKTFKDGGDEIATTMLESITKSIEENGGVIGDALFDTLSGSNDMAFGQVSMDSRSIYAAKTYEARAKHQASGMGKFGETMVGRGLGYLSAISPKKIRYNQHSMGGTTSFGMLGLVDKSGSKDDKVNITDAADLGISIAVKQRLLDKNGALNKLLSKEDMNKLKADQVEAVFNREFGNIDETKLTEAQKQEIETNKWLATTMVNQQVDPEKMELAHKIWVEDGPEAFANFITKTENIILEGGELIIRKINDRIGKELDLLGKTFQNMGQVGLKGALGISSLQGIIQGMKDIQTLENDKFNISGVEMDVFDLLNIDVNEVREYGRSQSNKYLGTTEVIPDNSLYGTIRQNPLMSTLLPSRDKTNNIGGELFELAPGITQEIVQEALFPDPLVSDFLPGLTGMNDSLMRAANALDEGLVSSSIFTSEQLRGFGTELGEMNSIIRKIGILEEFKALAKYSGAGTTGIDTAIGSFVDSLTLGGKSMMEVLSDPTELANLLESVEFGDINVDNSVNAPIVVRINSVSGTEDAAILADQIVGELNKKTREITS